MIAAYRFYQIFYPYIVILDFSFDENIPVQSIDTAVENAYNHEQVKEWISLLAVALPSTDVAVSSSFNLEGNTMKIVCGTKSS